MQTKNLLHVFEYAVIPSVSLVSLAKTAKHPVAEHLPLMQVRIDFEDGKLILKGDWHFLMASNRQADPSWFSFHSGRVTIEADIYPTGVIDLDDHNNDGSVFPVQGIVKDGNNFNSCSGLLLLDKIENHEWSISFFLYDYEVDNCEIKFKLSVYTTSRNANSN